MAIWTLVLTYTDTNTLSWIDVEGEFRELAPLAGKCADSLAEFGQVCEAIAVANGSIDWYAVNTKGNTCLTRPLWKHSVSGDIQWPMWANVIDEPENSNTSNE